MAASPVSVSFALEQKKLRAHFEVKASSINAKEVFDKGELPYQFDVVEIFLSVTGKKFPYYEFEVSPFNQTYSVKVRAAGKPFEEGVDLGLQSQTRHMESGWVADLEIPLERLGWKGDPKNLVGNAYAIFGLAPERSYWSLFPLGEKKNKFHQPDFFQVFFSASESCR